MLTIVVNTKRHRNIRNFMLSRYTIVIGLNKLQILIFMELIMLFKNYKAKNAIF